MPVNYAHKMVNCAEQSCLFSYTCFQLTILPDNYKIQVINFVFSFTSGLELYICMMFTSDSVSWNKFLYVGGILLP